VPSHDSPPPKDLVAVNDAEELCRQLLDTPWRWRRSTRHTEAVELLGKVHGTGDLATSFVALLLCTCRRWDRVTARLIAAIDDSGLLDDTDLDELAESFLVHERVISYPLTRLSPQWMDIDVANGTSRACTVDADTLEHHRLSVEPPLRRWASRRVLQADPPRLPDLLSAAGRFKPHHGAALIHGMLNAASALDIVARRKVIERGLQTARSSVRRAALDRLCELDGAAAAQRRARSDSNATVRAWQPPRSEPTQVSLGI